MKPSGYWMRTRRGEPVMSSLMLDVLLRLQAALRDDTPFIHLENVHKRTLNALLCRDYIFASPGLDGVRYKLTGRGEKAIQIYNAPPLRRSDGLCPTCGIHPIHHYSTGASAGYCKECASAYKNLQQKRLRKQQRGRICPDCRERECYVTSTGSLRAWCKPCMDKRRKIEREKRRRIALERVQSGEVLLCYCCKAKPRQVTANTVQDYCFDCTKRKKYERLLKAKGIAS